MLKYAAVLILAITAAAASPESRALAVTGPDQRELVEGRTYRITWEGEGCERVRVSARGVRTPLGKSSRGEFELPIAESAPAQEGFVDWQVPWLDAIRFSLAVTGLDEQGAPVCHHERAFEFRPAILARRTADGVYLDLHQRANQRLYVQQSGRLTHAFLSSSSEHYRWLPPSRHPKASHDHAGVFRVRAKKRLHISRLFNAKMPWSLQYLSGHFIHGTIPEYYPALGRPASHGCNRLTEEDAFLLYRVIAVGTRVEVIGPRR